MYKFNLLIQMRNIFKILCIALIVFSCVKCKKVSQIEKEVKIDLVVSAMTSGIWNMVYFKENGVENPVLASYAFKYYENFTVDASKNGSTYRGTWGASEATMTTNANFPATSGDQLTKINGNWTIVRSTWTMVEAKQTVGGVELFMRLEK